MVHIGIFTSHLPYIVIVLAYAVYFVSGFFAGEQDFVQEIDFNDVQTIHADSNFDADTSDNCFAFNDYWGLEIDFEERLVSPSYQSYVVGFKIVKLDLKLNISEVLFSRPPPVLA